MATPHKRGVALAGLFVVSYLGLAVPPLALGIATRYTPVTAAVTAFTVAMLALLALTGLLSRRADNRLNQAPAPSSPTS